MEDKNKQELAVTILKTLRESQAKSMPLLELSAVSGLDYEVLQTIVDQLETKHLVRIANKHNVQEEIITLRQQAFTALV